MWVIINTNHHHDIIAPCHLGHDDDGVSNIIVSRNIIMSNIIIIVSRNPPGGVCSGGRAQGEMGAENMIRRGVHGIAAAESSGDAPCTARRCAFQEEEESTWNRGS